MLYSLDDYMEGDIFSALRIRALIFHSVQKAQEKEIDEMIDEIAPHQEFKTRKQIRYEKYGIDEDEDAILNQKIHMPRRKQHEIFESVDDLSERHKVLPF